jgi:thymidylate synthase
MNNLDKQYINLLQDILENGVRKQDRTGTGTLSVFGRQIRHKMSDGFPLLTTKKMPFKTITTELVWFLRGDTNIKFLVDNNCHIWNGDAYKNYENKYYKGEAFGYKKLNNLEYSPDLKLSQEEFINKIKTDDEFAKKWGELGPIYGKQWRNWGSTIDLHPVGKGVKYFVDGTDQIANLINDLKTNPDSRRLMVNAWNVGEIDQMTLPPCHYGFQVYTRELSLDEKIDLLPEKKDWDDYDTLSFKEKIEKGPQRAISLMWNQRSVDTFLGLPFNIASYGLLLEIIAKLVNMVPDELIGNLGDTHLYSNHIEQTKEQIGREPHPLPTLNINTEWWPTESGESGIGPISTDGFLQGLDNNIQHFIRCLIDDDLQLVNYQSHSHIKAPLSN